MSLSVILLLLCLSLLSTATIFSLEDIYLAPPGSAGYFRYIQAMFASKSKSRQSYVDIDVQVTRSLAGVGEKAQVEVAVIESNDFNVIGFPSGADPRVCFSNWEGIVLNSKEWFCYSLFAVMKRKWQVMYQDVMLLRL